MQQKKRNCVRAKRGERFQETCGIRLSNSGRQSDSLPEITVMAVIEFRGARRVIRRMRVQTGLGKALASLPRVFRKLPAFSGRLPIQAYWGLVPAERCIIGLKSVLGVVGMFGSFIALMWPCTGRVAHRGISGESCSALCLDHCWPMCGAVMLGWTAPDGICRARL